MIIHITKFRREEFFSNKTINRYIKIVSEMCVIRELRIILLEYYLLQNFR